MKKAKIKPVSKEIEALLAMQEEDIDLSDVPEVSLDAPRAVGKFYRPIKRAITGPPRCRRPGLAPIAGEGISDSHQSIAAPRDADGDIEKVMRLGVWQRTELPDQFPPRAGHHLAPGGIGIGAKRQFKGVARSMRSRGSQSHPCKREWNGATTIGALHGITDNGPK
jgi:hypothetical protein